MKLQIAFWVLLLITGLSASAQTANAPAEGTTMNCTLTFSDTQKTIHNPTEADMRAALKASDNSDAVGPVFQITLEASTESLQVDLNDKNQFSFDYSDGQNASVSRRNDFSLDEALKVLMAFCNRAVDWKKMVEWQN